MMRIAFACIIFFYYSPTVFSQNVPDPLKTRLAAATSERQKDSVIIGYVTRRALADNAQMQAAFALMAYLNSQGDSLGTTFTKLAIAKEMSLHGDYFTGLHQSLECRAAFERLHYDRGIAESDIAIGDAFVAGLDYPRSFDYFKKAIVLCTTLGDSGLLSIALNELGAGYAVAQMPDSGLIYSQQAVHLDEILGATRELCFSIGSLGESYIAGKEYDLAIPFLRRSLGYSKASSDFWSWGYVLNDLAESFMGLSQWDSAERYARLSLSISIPNKFMTQVQRSYDYLSRIFDRRESRDSANRYFRMSVIAKDSIYSLQKAQSVQALAYQEEIRQSEAEVQRGIAIRQRREYIQFAAMAIGIIVLLLFFLILSRSIVVNEKWVSFLSVLGLLVVFEFINLILHPVLENLTDHSPALMLVALVVIAGILVPFHHRLERRIRARMVEKNKVIRLAAAKRTIQQLEGDANRATD